MEEKSELPSRRAAYRAEWICPVDRAPLRDAILTVEDHRIGWLGPRRDFGEKAVDLGRVALVPGLVNAHTHLEFSGLIEPLGNPGMAFTDWIREVVNYRRAQQVGDSRAEQKANDIHAGIAESIAAGVAAIGEIASQPWSKTDYGSALETTLFVEQLGGGDKGAQGLKGARQLLSATSPHRLRLALSPHAPYTVDHDLMEDVVDLAVQKKCPLAMHLAESREEIELLRSNAGPFVDLLRELDAYDPDKFVDRQLVYYLRQMARCDRSVVVHGNYLGDEEIGLIANHREKMSIVYCPRTHRYFDHCAYPLSQFLESGICVAIGTDSRASNPDLDLWSELRTASEIHPGVASDQILRMGTLNAARAIGREATLGSLAPGKRAAINVVAVDDSAISSSSCEWLFEPRTTCQSLEHFLGTYRGSP